MSMFTKIKIPLLLVFSLAAAAAAILDRSGLRRRLELCVGSIARQDRRLEARGAGTTANRGQSHDGLDRHRDDRRGREPRVRRDVQRLD